MSDPPIWQKIVGGESLRHKPATMTRVGARLHSNVRPASGASEFLKLCNASASRDCNLAQEFSTWEFSFSFFESFSANKKHMGVGKDGEYTYYLPPALKRLQRARSPPPPKTALAALFLFT